MKFRIAFEWDDALGLRLEEMYSFREQIEDFFNERNYGNAINTISIVVNGLGYDVKQRKRLKKDIGRFEYDILLDYFLIKNVGVERKKEIIRTQIVEITQQTMRKYKFENFDQAAFLSDLKEKVNSIDW